MKVGDRIELRIGRERTFEPPQETDLSECEGSAGRNSHERSWLEALVEEIRLGKHPRIDVRRLRRLASEVSLSRAMFERLRKPHGGLEYLTLEIDLRMTHGGLLLTRAIADFSTEKDRRRLRRILKELEQLSRSHPSSVTRREAKKVLKAPGNFRLTPGRGDGRGTSTSR